MELSPQISTVIILVVLFGLLAGGTWISITLAATGLFGLIFMCAGGMQKMMSEIMFNNMTSYTLMAVPLFVFMGYLIVKSEISDHLYEGVSKWLGIVPGGLLHSNILSCAIFAACSGSSTATEIAIGTGAVPQLLKRGYERKITLGSIAAGSTLGILIPPSVTMIVFGVYTGVSVGKLFIGGVIPGIILAGMFMVYIGVSVVRRPQWAPKREKFVAKVYFPQVLKSFKEIWPYMLIIIFIMGSIYGGLATPTEAAGLACMITLLEIVLYYRKFSFQMFKDAAMETVALTGFYMLEIVGARTLAMALSMMGVPTYLCAVIGGLHMSRILIWFCVVLIYTLLGCLMDGLDLMLVTTPIFFPLVVHTLGFDPVWFGVTLTVILEMSLLTPPVGLNMYIVHAIGGGKRLQDTIKGIIPFFVCMVLCVILLTFIPSLCTWLPSLMAHR
ncbi:MAG TPA: TRAP transporter large permease [Euryarchaeota archaeon]|nr:TRAP transporter large permease [Euryarchaeota archaeon]